GGRRRSAICQSRATRAPSACGGSSEAGNLEPVGEAIMLDLIIKDGQVVTPQGVGALDIGVQKGKIVALGWPGTLAADAGRIVDARGTIVVPGGIEPHAHISIPVPEQWAGQPDVMTQPPEAASRAAAFGGVTTIVDFAGDLSLTRDPTARRGARPAAPGRRGGRRFRPLRTPTP